MVSEVILDAQQADQGQPTVHTAENSRQTSFEVHDSHRGMNYQPHIQLTPAQELAAVSSFLTSLTEVVIPSYVDPSRPIDPQLVLDFDTRGQRAAAEVEGMVKDVWARNPVYLYSKRYSSASREIKGIIESLQLDPTPMIIDVDLRDDSRVLEPMLHRLTGSMTLPVLLIGGQPFSSIEDIRAWHKSGELQQLIQNSGSVIHGAKVKKHRK